MNIQQSCQESELKGLEAIRDKLAADLEVAEPSYSAQIAGRLDATLARIEAVKKSKPTGGTRLGELVGIDGGRQAGAQRRASPGRNRDKRTG